MPFLRQILTFLELACVKILVSVMSLYLNQVTGQYRKGCEHTYEIWQIDIATILNPMLSLCWIQSPFHSIL